MCQGCELTGEEAKTIEVLECDGCTALVYLPDLPLCTELYCDGCTALISLPDLPLCTVLRCYDCTSLMSLPDLPLCTRLGCGGCASLTSLPDLPVCTNLNCYGCTSLMSLPDLPVCTELWCSDLPHLTHITVPAKCDVSCRNSPISVYNNDLYLSYINDRSNIITSSIRNSHNYEHGIVGIIAEYL
jgi:hypothetical protein